MSNYRLWVNEDRTLLVRIWENGTMEVASRPAAGGTWGPPVVVEEQKVDYGPRGG